MEITLRSPAQVEKNQGFLPPPEKDLKSLSSTRLEAGFPYHDSRAMTRSPSPCAWTPDFTGVPNTVVGTLFIVINEAGASRSLLSWIATFREGKS